MIGNGEVLDGVLDDQTEIDHLGEGELLIALQNDGDHHYCLDEERTVGGILDIAQHALHLDYQIQIVWSHVCQCRILSTKMWEMGIKRQIKSQQRNVNSAAGLKNAVSFREVVTQKVSK